MKGVLVSQGSISQNRQVQVYRHPIEMCINRNTRISMGCTDTKRCPVIQALESLTFFVILFQFFLSAGSESCELGARVEEGNKTQEVRVAT